MENKMSLSWAQATLAPPKPQVKYVYSKEYLLSFYKEAISISETLETSLGATVHDPVPPLANIPLTELEIKLFSSSNFNSESNKRSNYQKKDENNQRNTKHNQKGQKPISAGDNLRSSKLPESKNSNDAESSDLWDTPAGIGNFGTDGVFQDKQKIEISENQSPEAISFGSMKSAKNTNNRFGLPANPIAANPIPEVSKVESSNRTQLPTPTQVTVSPELLMLNSTSEIIPNSKDKSHLMSQTMPNNRPMIPPFTHQPQGWVYRDRTGVMQGPFSPQEMQNWYTEGFFPTDLPIRHMDDPSFQSLSNLINRYGPHSPFLVDMEERHSMARMLYDRRILHLGSEIQSRVVPFGGQIGNPQTHSREGSWGHNVNTWDEASNMNRHLQFQKPSIESSHPMQQKQIPVLQQHQHQQMQQSQLPNVVPESLMKFAYQDTSNVSGAIAKPTLREKASAIDNKIIANSPNIVASPEVIGPKATPTIAPWANSVEKTPGVLNGTIVKTPSLKEIQNLQQKRQSAKDQERTKSAEESILAQAAAIRESEINSPSSRTSEGPVWGQSKSVTSPSTITKSLSQIILEEQNEKAQSVTANIPVMGGVKRYADLVQKNNTSTTGWQVVGKKPSVAEIKSVTIVSPAQPRASPHAGVSVPAKAAIVSVKTNSPTTQTSSAGQIKGGMKQAVVSASFTNWFFSALQHIPASSEVNVKQLYSLLISMPLTDKSFLMNVCDDALGGITCIDARKFVEEYIRRRQLDQQNVVMSSANIPKSNAASEPEGFQIVGKKKNKKLK